MEERAQPPLDFMDAFRKSPFVSLCSAKNRIVKGKVATVSEKGTVTLDIGAKLPVVLRGYMSGLRPREGAVVHVEVQELETVTHLVGCRPLAHLTGTAKATIVRKTAL